MKHDKGKAWTLILLFCGFLAFLLVCFLVFPKGEMSRTERRVLAKPPRLSASAVLDGTYEKQAETYLADHFPFRRHFVSLEAHAQLYTGNNGAKGVYAGKDGYLIPVPVQADEKNIAVNRDALRSFARGLEIPCDLLAVPGAGAVLAENLPPNHGVYPDSEMIYSEFGKELLPWVQTPDIFGILETAERQVFYKTDHHWTTGGAYLAYGAYLRSIGMEPLPEEAFAVERYPGFYGTGYAKSGLWETAPDTLELYRPPADASVEIIDSDYKESVRADSMFFPAHLESGDMYSVFLDGNHSLTRVTNPQGGAGRLLVLKDSFAHALAPFLAQHFGQIDMVDLRYYTKPVSALVEEQGYDRVLMVYSVSTLCEYRDLARLR